MALYKDCGCKLVELAVRSHLVNFCRRFASSSETLKIQKWKKNLHIYSYSFNWGGLSELAHVLANNVIMNEDGLVVLNKPHGIGKEEPIINKSRIEREKRLRTAIVGEKDFYLNEILPLLAHKLGYEHLETVKIPERYTSGVSVLSSSQELTNHVKNCIQKGKNQGKILDTYHVVCVGTPSPISYKGKVAIQHEQDKICGGSQPILLTKWSKNSAKRGDVTTVSVEHTTLQQGPFASLVEVKPSRTKSHFLRVYMAYMMSPILGDNLYGSRVQNVGGRSLAISPFSDRAKLPQRLEDPMLAALDLERQDERFIPAHVHLHRVEIPDFGGKGKPLEIEAPPPEVFSWTCKQVIYKGSPKVERADVKC
ncbi:hypothetical protein R5R35_000273 [Gryllus longicercus]|uniref:Uncharacterized protein n=1 Tax=Gryllus longicercus TaxID=2509291 RepID=A0AAN9VTX2_9ORTH